MTAPMVLSNLCSKVLLSVSGTSGFGHILINGLRESLEFDHYESIIFDLSFNMISLETPFSLNLRQISLIHIYGQVDAGHKPSKSSSAFLNFKFITCQRTTNLLLITSHISRLPLE